ncbi:hypothetical protein GG344DRAFT_71009 [Lentinula edodes]|nr:hypothetical protein GG344DRAFT_71009 [Lentinula edodes]
MHRVSAIRRSDEHDNNTRLVNLRMLLNKEQQEVKDLLKSSIRAFLRGEAEEQMLLLVHGPSGTGKTTVVQAIATLFDDMECTQHLLMASPTEISAKSIGGTHLTLSSVNKELLNEKKYIIIDNCSALSAKVLQKVASTLWDPEDVAQDVIPFGHRHVVLFGDFLQHPPFDRHWDTLWWPNYEASLVVNAVMKRIIVFHHDMTGAPNTWVELTRRVRNGTQNSNDTAALNKHVVGLYDVPRITDLYPDWTDGVVIASNPVQRQYWNINMASRISRGSQKTLYICPSSDEYVFGEGERMGVRDLEAISVKLKREFSMLQSLYLFEGMPVVILHGEFKNAWGQVTNIVINKHEKVPRDAAEYRLVYAVKEVTVRLSAKDVRSRPGSSDDVIFTPTTHRFTIAHPSDERRRVVVERTQVPLMPRFALLEYETVGVQFKKVVVDTQNGLKAFRSPYMAITRSQKVYFSNRIQDGEREEDEVSANDLRDRVLKIESV